VPQHLGAFRTSSHTFSQATYLGPIFIWQDGARVGALQTPGMLPGHTRTLPYCGRGRRAWRRYLHVAHLPLPLSQLYILSTPSARPGLISYNHLQQDGGVVNTACLLTVSQASGRLRYPRPTLPPRLLVSPRCSLALPNGSLLRVTLARDATHAHGAACSPLFWRRLIPPARPARRLVCCVWRRYISAFSAFSRLPSRGH